MTEARDTKKILLWKKTALSLASDFLLALTMNYTLREKSEFQQDSGGLQR